MRLNRYKSRLVLEYRYNPFIVFQKSTMANPTPQQLGFPEGFVPKGVDISNIALVPHCFNQMLLDFLTMLSETFPENSPLVAARSAVELAAQMRPDESRKRWLKNMTPYEKYILGTRSAENEKAFLADANKIELIKQIDILSYWSELDDEEKDVIWDHLGALHTVAKTIEQLNSGTTKEVRKN